MILVQTLEWFGRTVRDSSNAIHDLAGRHAGQRNLALSSIRDDSANPEDRMPQLVVVMLALFGQMDRSIGHVFAVQVSRASAEYAA